MIPLLGLLLAARRAKLARHVARLRHGLLQPNQGFGADLIINATRCRTAIINAAR